MIIAFLSLLVVTVVTPVTFASAANLDPSSLPWPPTQSSGPYAATLGGTTLFANVISPPELVGAIPFQMGAAGTSFPFLKLVEDPIDGWSWTVEVTFAHKSDDIYGCTTYHTKDEFNQTFTNKLLIAKLGGGCSAGVKSQIIGGSGAAGILINNCEPTAPSFCSAGLTKLFTDRDGRIPGMNIPYEGGTLIRTYLESRRNYTANWYAASPSSQSSMSPIDVAYPPVRIKWVASGPIVPEERAAMIEIIKQTPQVDLSAQNGFNQNWNALLTNSTLDPCLDHLAAVHCENGHMVTLFGSRAWKTSRGLMHSSFGTFRQLRVLSLNSNSFYGPMPDTMCQLTKLQLFFACCQVEEVGYPVGFTSMPDCLGALNQLEGFQVYSNSLTRLPSTLSNMTKLFQFDMSFNKLTELPTNLEKLVSMQTFDVGNNQIQGTMFNISTWKQINLFSLQQNAFSGQIPPHAFDNLPVLDWVGLGLNQFSGPLPLFENSPAVTQILVNNNQFDLIPSAWPKNLPNLNNLLASYNKLVSPLPILGGLANFQTIDLSHNQLSCIDSNGQPTQDLSPIIQSLLSLSTTSLALNSNNFSCEFIAGIPTTGALTSLTLANNQITRFTWFNMGNIEVLDLGSNNLTMGNLELIPSGYRGTFGNLRYVSFLNNPNLFVGSPLSDVFSLDYSEVQSLGDYVCPTIYWTDSPINRAFHTDPQFYGWVGCKCGAGFFGAAPLCQVVPMAARLVPFTSVASVGIDNFEALVSTAPLLGGGRNQSFTDGWYGSNRLTLGVNTAWNIDLSNLIVGQIPNCPSISSTSTSSPSQSNTYDYIQFLEQNCLPEMSGATRSLGGTPVRTIYLRLELNRQYFASATDVLQVFEGGESLTGSRLFVMHGDELLSHPIVLESTINGSSISAVWPDPLVGFTRSAPYRAAYSEALSTLNSSVLITIPVFTRSVSVSYQSRRTSGTGFYATYSYSFECPTGYFFNAESDRCALELIPYYPSTTVQGVVYAASAVSMLFVSGCFIMMFFAWNSAVIRAASRGFLLLVLASLFIMSFGGLLFAASPATYLDKGDQTTADALCAGRVWLSALPLVLIMAVLLAKTERLNNIFNQKKLHVTTVSNIDLLMYVLILCSVEIIFTSVHSGLPLSRAVKESGSGSLSQYLVSSCSQESGFKAWLGVQIAFVATLMLRAAFLAFRTRNLPTRFNEGISIAQALCVLIFFLVLIVPLDLLIQSDPNASIIIQGIGQVLLTMLLTGILFLPKAYHLYYTSDGEKKNSNIGGTTVLAKDGSSSAGLQLAQVPQGHAGGSKGKETQRPSNHSGRTPNHMRATSSSAAAGFVPTTTTTTTTPSASKALTPLPARSHSLPPVTPEPETRSSIPPPPPSPLGLDTVTPLPLPADFRSERPSEEVISPTEIHITAATATPK